MRNGSPSSFALSGVAAALLPPEAGGPDPEAVANATGRLLRHLPPSVRAGTRGTALAVEAASLLRHGSRLERLDPARRTELLLRLRSFGFPGAALVDSLKSLVMLGWGAESYRDEIARVANAHEPARPEPELDLTAAREWPLRSACDVVVVGSGAGGAFAALELARAGRDVVIVEEGEHWSVERIRATDPIDRFGSLYRDGGATATLGNPTVALPLGRAVGGTTVINSGTCFRPPDHVRRRWHREAGLRLAEPEQLERRLGEVEEMLSVAPSPAGVLGRNAELALAGADALGLDARPLDRNAPGCRGACQCALGCPNGAKKGVHRSALPAACEAGARIVSGLKVDRLLVEDGAVTGVLGRREGGAEVRIDAPAVVVAAGTTETPPLLRRSGLGRHPRLGYGLSIHPAVGIAGSFAEEVTAWRGVLQSVGIEELHERHGVMIEATSSPPGMGAITLPGYGEDLVRRLERAEHLASLGALIADPPSGRVIGARRPLLLYRLSRTSAARLRLAIETMARVLLAAGAESVELGGGAAPVSDPASLEREIGRLDVRDLRLAAFHPTGTAAAGADPGRHPVDGDGRLRGVRGAWVADASILPSCPGVNPQISITALAAGVGANAGSD